MQITDSDQLNQSDMSLQPAPTPSPHGPRRKPRFRKFIIIAVIAIIVIAGGAVAYIRFALGDDASGGDSQAPAPVQTEKVDPVTRDVPDTVNTETFKSTALGIDFSYPNTWKVTEADNGLRIESETFTYKAITAAEIKGSFKIYVRMGARPADSAIIGRGYAIAPSQKLTYTKPLAGQRSDTLITPFGLDEPNNFAYFMIAGNFQLAKGDTLGPNYAKEADAFVIAGGYTSPDQKVDLATNEVPATTYDKSNAYKQAIAILESFQVH
jgi:hypothetical protein